MKAVSQTERERGDKKLKLRVDSEDSEVSLCRRLTLKCVYICVCADRMSAVLPELLVFHCCIYISSPLCTGGRDRDGGRTEVKWKQRKIKTKTQKG